MTGQRLWIAITCLAAVLLDVWSRPWMAAWTAVLVLPCGLALDWRRLRAATIARFRRDDTPEWAGRLPLAGQAATLDLEWRELGYEPLGCLRSGKCLLAVYLHPALPIYAAIRTEPGSAAVPFALTFFEGGGRVLTTAAPALEGAVAAALSRPQAPRLVQLRAGGRPLALDGQHVGTVKAWTAGNRVPLPADRECLPAQLQSDREGVQADLDAGLGFTFLDYARLLVGLPRGVLTF